MGNYVANIDYLIIFLYIIMLISIGIYSYRKDSTYDEFMLAGRGMTTPMLISTMVSTYYGLDILFGSSEMAFNDGLMAFFGYALSTLVFYLFIAFYMSKKLRAANFVSLPEILEKAYGRKTSSIGAISSMVYCLPTTSLFALGRVSEFVFGIDAHYGALILGGIALAYTLLGGLKAVAITDTIQFSLMCITVAVGVPLLVQEVGGFSAIQNIVPEGHFELFGTVPPWLLLAYASSSIAVLIDPSLYQRIFASRNARQARNAILASTVIWTTFDWLVVAGGIAALAAVTTGILSSSVHPNDAFLIAVTYALPIGLSGIFLAGVLATAMSTIDGYTLVAGSNISYDIYRPLAKPDATDAELVKATKISIVIAWTLGYLVAFQFDRIMALLIFVTTVITSTVFVPVLMALFYQGKKTSLAGLLSCSVGLFSVLTFYIGLAQIGDYNELWGTYIWSFSIGHYTFSIWQEYALFFCLPLSLLGFFVGNLFGKHTGGDQIRGDVR
ncbi:MAG: sodium:solute symporter family protein [Pseudomonadota bacterium]|nr:sodium:solute symporter family protein [Pseudomonadota bacterium]